MTDISLEEHVARALAEDAGFVIAEEAKPRLSWMRKARAAIAAVREHAPDPAEAMRAEIDWLKSAGRKQGQQIADSVEIEISERAEAMRAKTLDECEAIVRAGTPVMNPHSQFVCRTLADRIAALKGKGEG